MTAYDELVERCIMHPTDCTEAEMRLVLAEVFRTLHTVTPEMKKARGINVMGSEDTVDGYLDYWDAEGVWLAMLRAAPLVP